MGFEKKRRTAIPDGYSLGDNFHLSPVTGGYRLTHATKVLMKDGSWEFSMSLLDRNGWGGARVFTSIEEAEEFASSIEEEPEGVSKSKPPFPKGEECQ